ncbi:MAG: nicotinate-nucleotide adenylyltransferase [Burkholderiales bacterium]
MPNAAPIGIFGGSFDPLHNAHLRLAFSALDHLGLQSVRWLPNSVPGHREGPRASASHRLAMLHLALDAEARFVIDEAELWQTEATYSINTLLRLRGELGTSVPLVFIIGADHLLGLHRWREWQRLFDFTHFAVAARPGFEIGDTSLTPEVAMEYTRRSKPIASLASSPAGCMVNFPFEPMDIASRSIRSALASGSDSTQALTPLLPAPVLQYIQDKHLYRPTL